MYIEGSHPYDNFEINESGISGIADTRTRPLPTRESTARLLISPLGVTALSETTDSYMGLLRAAGLPEEEILIKASEFLNPKIRNCIKGEVTDIDVVGVSSILMAKAENDAKHDPISTGLIPMQEGASYEVRQNGI